MSAHEDGGKPTCPRSLQIELPDAVLDEIVRLVLKELQPAENGGAAKYLSPADAASYIGKSRQRIYDLLSMGELTKFQDGSSVLISVEELERHLRGEPTGRRAR